MWRCLPVRSVSSSHARPEEWPPRSCKCPLKSLFPWQRRAWRRLPLSSFRHRTPGTSQAQPVAGSHAANTSPGHVTDEVIQVKKQKKVQLSSLPGRLFTQFCPDLKSRDSDRVKVRAAIAVWSLKWTVRRPSLRSAGTDGAETKHSGPRRFWGDAITTT